MWEVDTEKREAHIAQRSHRQLTPMDARLNVNTLVEELATLIKAGADDPRLVWKDGKSTVRIDIGRTIPATNKQTTADRRRRFREALLVRTAANGWEQLPRYAFRVR